MLVPELSSYTQSEINICTEHSVAIKNYLNLIHQEPKNPLQKIKLQRHKSWLRASMAEVLNKSTTKNICQFWSDETDLILKKTWKVLGGSENLALFSLGKLGAQELNLSSDIDILIVSLKPYTKKDLTFYRKFNNFLSNFDEISFCYRLDYDLRPGGRIGPIICSTQQLEDYYWNQAVTWERVALNRLRSICGLVDIINTVLEIKKSFCYRKFIDYIVIEDIKNIRTHIHDHNSLDPMINIKLQPGGIRDIELYINCLQIIHGGKIKTLQTSNTSKAIEELKLNKILPEDQLEILASSYWTFRKIENLEQIKNDSQTHELTNPTKEILNTFKKINDIVSTLIGEKPKTPPLLPANIDAQIDWLLNLGFNQKVIQTYWPKILKLTVLSKNNQIDEIYRSRFLHKFINDVINFGLDKNLSIELLFKFLKSIRAKKSFFHLLEQNSDIIKELAILFSTSPFLGHQICNRPEILDSYLYKTRHIIPKDTESLLSELLDLKLMNQLLSSSQLLSHNPVERLLESCSFTADTIATHLLENLKTQFDKSSLNILKLGKWGGEDMGLTSDLDFIFVTENKICEDDIKVSRRFISYLTNRHQGGEIYSVDLRLRARSGAGPLITSKDKLLEYIREEAKLWELQSYLRCSSLLVSNLQKSVFDSIRERNFKSNEINELKIIKEKVIKENSINNTDILNLKYSKGGLVDIEFTTQHYFLKNNISPTDLQTHKMLLDIKQTVLAKNYLYLRYLEQITNIICQNQKAEISFEGEPFKRIAQHLKTAPNKLSSEIKDLLLNNQKLLNAV